MFKRIAVLALSIACCLAIAGCGGGSKGLGTAYDELQKTSFSSEGTSFKYDEESDTLIVSLSSSKDDVEKFFDVLDKSVDGADIGNLYFASTEIKMMDMDYAQTFSERLGALKCNSIAYLDVSGFMAGLDDSRLPDDGAWTGILPKVGMLGIDEGKVGWFAEYSNDALANLANVKKLCFGWSFGTVGLEHIGVFSGVEEISCIAGPTSEISEKVLESGFDWSEGFDDLEHLGELKSLDRVLVYPDAESWEPNDEYYTFAVAMQSWYPDLKTNEPGKGWNGDEASLVTFGSIDAMEAGAGDMLASKIKSWRLTEASSVLDAGKDFTAKSGTPKLDGPCLVGASLNWQASGWQDSGAYTDMATYLYDSQKIMYDEFAGTPVKMPSLVKDYDYYIDAYPTFELVGTYGDTTEAYATTVNVQIYDVKNKIRYDAVQVATTQPPDTYTYSGNPKSQLYADFDYNSVVEYLSGLA